MNNYWKIFRLQFNAPWYCNLHHAKFQCFFEIKHFHYKINCGLEENHAFSVCSIIPKSTVLQSHYKTRCITQSNVSHMYNNV